MVALATGASAQSRNPFANCPPFISSDQFESQGGKLAITKQPDLASFPPAFLKDCRGRAGLMVVIRTDGSVGIGNSPKFFMEDKKRDTFETSMGCLFYVMHRVEKMRYMPPLVHGKPACVELLRFWHSSKPHELAVEP